MTVEFVYDAKKCYKRDFVLTIARTLIPRWNNDCMLTQIFRNNVSDGKSERRILGFTVDRLCSEFEWKQFRTAIGLRHRRAVILHWHCRCTRIV